MTKWRNDEIAKWRNGTKDKSHSYKVWPFHWNLHLLPNLFCGLSPQIKETPMHRRHGPFGNFDFSLSLLTERLGYSSSKWRRYISEEIYLFISYLPSSSGYDVMLWAPAITWNGLCTSRWSLLKIFGKYVLCTETEWRGMFISNRYCIYKVSFVVQCRYATCAEKWTCLKHER